MCEARAASTQIFAKPNDYARCVNPMRKAINSIAIACLIPTNLARESHATKSGIRYQLVRRLGQMTKFSFYLTLRDEHGFSRSAYGVWLRNRDDNTFRFCLRGNYGFVYSQHLRNEKQPFSYLDIGANIGLYSLIALENEQVLHVHSFDPDTATLPYLVANLEHTNSKKFTVHPYAVSSQAGTLTLNKELGHSGASTLQTPTFDAGEQETITAVDHLYMNEQFQDNRHRVLVKIDVEGHELSVLETLGRCNFINRVAENYAEFNSEMSDTRAMQTWFANHGFVETIRTGTERHWDALYQRISESS